MKIPSFLALVVILNLTTISCSSPESDLRKVQKKNTIESFRKFISKYENNRPIREKAIDELSDQAIIAMIAVNDINEYIRTKAFEKITDQKSLLLIISKNKDSDLVDAAWIKLNDQDILTNLADSATIERIRIRAVTKIRNDDFLLKKTRYDKSAAVRFASVIQINSESTLLNIATSSYYNELRTLAKNRITDPILSKQIVAWESHMKKRLIDIQIDTNQETLSEISLKGEYDIICMEATLKLTDQKLLANIVLNSKDRNVARAAFTKLNDIRSVENIFNNTSDKVIKMASSIRLNRNTWYDFFYEATLIGKTSEDLQNVLSAVSLLPRQNVNYLVRNACRTLIGIGDNSRIDELKKLLQDYGDENLAESYLNCGQTSLKNAGEEWAKKHGYYISNVKGSDCLHWGSLK
jgi:hypothetical protein